MSDRSDASLVEVLSADEGTYTSIARHLAEAEFARRQLPADALTAAAESRLLEAKQRATADIPGSVWAAVGAAIFVFPGLATPVLHVRAPLIAPALAAVVLPFLAIGLERDGYTTQARIVRWVVGGCALVAMGVFTVAMISRRLGAS